MIFDTHIHLNDTKILENLDFYIKDAIKNGVNRFLCVGFDIPSSKIAIEIANKYKEVYASIGVIPTEHKQYELENKKTYNELKKLYKTSSKIVAIGEIGLDYYWKENEPKEVQKRIFLEQVDLAKQFDLPVIIHDRDAHGDMLELFQKEVHGVQAVFHCFSGSLEIAKELAKRGYYFGFGGTSTYKNAKKVREVMQYIPKELLLFETDSPYLTPVPFRGKRNNPGYTEYTARNAAQVLGMEFEELAAIATANTKRLFKKIK